MRDEEKNGEKGLVPARVKRRVIKDYVDVPRTSGPREEEIDPYTYLQVIWKHRKIGFLFFSVVLITAIVVSFITKPMYYAQSTVEIALERPKVVAFEEVVEVNTQDPEFFNTQRDLIKSRSMAEAVLSKFDLWEHPEFYTFQPNLNPISIVFSYAIRFAKAVVNPIKLALTSSETGVAGGSGGDEIDWERKRKDGIIDVFLSRVRVVPSQDSRIIYIGFEAYSPSFAAKMANAIADTFVEWSLDRRLEATRNAREFLERQIEEVKADLERSEQALHRFEVENNIVSLDRNMNLVYRQLEELNSSLARTTAERTAKESLYKSIESGDPSTLIEVIEDPLIRELKSEYNRLLVEYSNLSAVFKPEYPPLKQLQAKISGIRNRINEETKKKILALRSDYQQTILKEEGLKKRLEEQEKLAMALNEKSIQYRILEREVQSNKSVYESLLQRLKETDVTGGIKSNPIQVLDHAAVPLTPFKPNIPRNVLLAFLVGLIGAVGIAFVREFFDRSIKTPEEITEKMNLPVLGAIVKLSGSSKKRVGSSARLYVAEPGSPFSEAIRTIRTSIVMSSESGDSLRSVLVTSCWPTEGKSTLASNLALSLAFGPNRVLLLEADLRHPSLGRAFGIDRNEPGLSNFLLADAEIEDIIHFTDTPQLFFIPAGSIISSSPSELLQAEKMKKLLDSLKEDFDYVIVDSPPTIGLSDSLVLSKLTDATVLVVSSGITMQRDIVHAVKQLSNVGARLLGVVVNRLDSKHENYYYRYNYYRNSA